MEYCFPFSELLMNLIIETSDATTALPIALANVKWRDVSDQQVSGHVVLF